MKPSSVLGRRILAALIATQEGLVGLRPASTLLSRWQPLWPAALGRQAAIPWRPPTVRPVLPLCRRRGIRFPDLSSKRNPQALMKTYLTNLLIRLGGASCGAWIILALLGGVHQVVAQPVVSFTQPTNGQQIVTFAGLAGTAQTTTGTVQQVTFSIYNQSTGQWWNGTSFQGASVSLPASLSGINWAPASGIALPPPCCGQYYQLTASATDTYTHIGTTNITVQADSVPPAATFSPLANGQTVSNLSAIGGSVTDNFGLVASVVFSIHERDINGGSGRWWNGTNFQSSLANLPASVSDTSWAPAAGVLLPPLNSGQNYDLTVVATDTTSNSASSTITVQAPITVLSWDPGQTPLGTAVLQRPNTNGGNYWFQIIQHRPAVGGLR